MANNRKMRLGAFLNNVGHHVASWRYPEAETGGILKLPFYKKLAQTAERGKFDMVFLADIHSVRRSQLPYSSNIRPEPLTLLSALSVVTERIGLAGTVSTTYNEPFHVARKFASLDHLSGGRAAWNVVTTANPDDAENFSRDEHPAHALRYERAKEFVDVVSKLWDSWEDEALVADKASGIFTDVGKVHALDHKGTYFSVQGPLSLSRTPQGRPVVIQAGSSEDGQELAAETAEVIFTAWQTLEEAQRFYSGLKGRLSKYGRSPEDLKIMPGVFPIIGRTEAEADEKETLLKELIHPKAGVGLLSAMISFDLSPYPLDVPLPELPHLDEIQGGKSRFKLLKDLADRENLTIRQLYQRTAGARGHREIKGTPVQIADQLEEWFHKGAADGFNIMPPHLPGGLDDFVDLVIPELQRRGLFRTEYEGTTLRENLGLPRSANRFNPVRA